MSKDQPTSEPVPLAAGGASPAPSRLPERIETPRLVIRLWELGDVEAIAAAVGASLEHLRPWMSWTAFEPMGINDRRGLVAQWLDAWNAGGDAPYGIFAKPAGESNEGPDRSLVVVGGTGLHRRIGDGGLEIGYWIHVDHLRRGYAAEAAHALTTSALELPGIDRVEIRHDKANVASAGIPATLGYRFVGEQERQPEAPAEVGVVWVWRTP